MHGASQPDYESVGICASQTLPGLRAELMLSEKSHQRSHMQTKVSVFQTNAVEVCLILMPSVCHTC